MKSCEQFYVVLFILSWVKGSFASKVDWITASKDCNAKYESQLIPRSYIEGKNLHNDVVEGIGVNVSAWIDGKIQRIGCDQVKCLQIKRLNEQQDRKLPFICVTSGDIEGNLTEVSYTESRELCGSAQFRVEGPLQKYAMFSVLHKFLPSPKPFAAFWLPNAELSDIEDTFCTYVVSRNNETVETKSDNCSAPKMGVCINTTYITDFRMSVMLEMTAKQWPPMKGDEVIWAMKTVSVSLALSALSLFLVVLFMCISILLWKRVSSKLNVFLNENRSTDAGNEIKSESNERKNKKKACTYEVLPQNTHGHSTRVKNLPMEQENPYSEITKRRESGYHNNPGTSGQTVETILLEN
ncbi:uncharacterized protein LOC134272140 isoform X2 [Saccostrea cucullata]|uniref:uncharacterized protein LOC134272140 isoform X2 n=1 Tax=Saccostrea cuccullata TaxID=36930 RepID=UPI002ED2C5A8